MTSHGLGLIRGQRGFAVGAGGRGHQGRGNGGFYGGAQAGDEHAGAAFGGHYDEIARDVLSGHSDVVADLHGGVDAGVPDGADDVDAQVGVNNAQAAGEGVVGGHG